MENHYSLSIQSRIEADVLVSGGGVAGIAAALAAVRAGADTVLIDREYMLGGLATMGLVTYYLPLCDGMGRQVSYGIAEELLKAAISFGAEADYPSAWIDDSWMPEHRKTQRFMVRYNAQLFALIAERVLLGAGVRILYGMQASEVAAEDNIIKSIIVQSRCDRSVISAKAYVDATGDASISHLAGESTRQFGQGNVLAAWYYAHDASGLHLNPLGACDTPDEYKTGEELDMLVPRRFLGIDGMELSDMTILSHDQVLRHVLERQKTMPATLPVTIATIPQVRMTRCIVGERTLDDKLPHTREASSIGLIGDWRKRGPVFELPFEALYGKRIANLYTAGRCISVTDAMWDITRVIPACAVTGQAAGTAAALHINERPAAMIVQKALEESGVILHESELPK